VVPGVLRRFAAPVDKPVLLDDEGFLLPTSDQGWAARGGVAPVPVVALLAGNVSFALLAAGGAGKTETFTALAEFETGARRINAAPLTRDGLERRITDACRAGTAVYLDGLDQAVSVDSLLFQWLEEELTAVTARRVRWRLACRSAVWDAALAGALQRGLPGFAEWKLLPLDQVAAQMAVEHAINSSGFDGAAFLGAVVEAGLGRLSACVGQLIAVARYWHARGALPSGAVEAMEFEVAWLLKETDGRRRPRMPGDRAMRVAKRLGAFTMFGGAQALTVAPVGDNATLTVDALPSEAEPVEPGQTIDPDDYREVLGTALFDAGPAGSVVFRHQRYVEYLAAAYLVERRVRAGQVPVLLGVHANGRLPTARVGVAAWLAALEPTLINRLITDNALMFASAAAVTELPSDEARTAVVAGLLTAATTGDAEPAWSLDRSALIHPGLGDQLAAYLSAGLASSEQVWWIARLAAAGECHALAPALAVAASDSTWHAYARRAAVAALGVLRDDDTRRSVRELLVPDHSDGSDPDTDNEVRAAVIDVLYPRLLSTEDLTRALRPHLSMLYGGYRQTLRELPDRIPDQDLASFVTWLATRPEQPEASDDEDHFEDLYLGVMRRAWQCADDEAVRQALARLVVAGVQSGRWYRPGRRSGVLWSDGPTVRRRALAVEVASTRANTWYAVFTLALLTVDDVEWLLDTLPTVPLQAADSLLKCLPQLLRDPPAHVADRILDLPPNHPAYDATAHLRGKVNLDSEHIQVERRIAAEDREHEREQAEHQERVQTELTAALERLDAEPGAWWRIPWLLADDRINTPEHVTGHDLTQRPGWGHLDTDQRQLVLDAGIRYLHIHHPNPAPWAGLTSWSFHTVLPDWSGVHLLTTLRQHHPDRLTELAPAVWKRWASSIVATPVFGPDQAGDLRCRLIDAAPAAVWPDFLDAALTHLDALEIGGRSLTPYEIYKHLIADVTDAIADRLNTTATESELARDLLTLLVRHGSPSIALDTCRRLIDRPESPLAAHARTHLAQLDPNSVVDTLAVTPHTPEDLAEGVQGLQSTRLDHSHLVTAATLLLDTHPYADEPPLDRGFINYTAHHHARDLRSQVLEQLALGGHLNDLTALKHDRPDLDQQILTRYERIAKAHQADLALAATDPQALISLLRRGDARLVRDDADLQHVLLQHLDALQRHLTDTSAFREIWNGERPQVEDDVSDWLQRRLHERLATGLIIDREVQVNRPRPGGIGTRIDLTATTTTPTNDTARVIIEAKRVDNDELMTAMHQQLIRRYLIPEQRRYGIYLVYWITPGQRPPGWSRTTAADPKALAQQLREQAHQADQEGMRITPYILDISRPT
jgi:hypothetical protein